MQKISKISNFTRENFIKAIINRILNSRSTYFLNWTVLHWTQWLEQILERVKFLRISKKKIQKFRFLKFRMENEKFDQILIISTWKWTYSLEIRIKTFWISIKNGWIWKIVIFDQKISHFDFHLWPVFMIEIKNCILLLKNE